MVTNFSDYKPLELKIWETYTKKFFPVAVTVYDTTFYFIFVKRGKRKLYLCFKALNSSYFKTLSQSDTFDLDMLKKHAKELYFQIFGLTQFDFDYGKVIQTSQE